MTADLQANPLFLRGKQLAGDYGQDPFTYSPEAQANILGQMYDQGQNAYSSAMQASLEQIGAAGGLRQGATRGEMNRLALGLGQHRANSTRDMMVKARESRSTDIQNLLAMLNNMNTVEGQPQYAKANMLSGAAANPIWAQASPLQSITGAVAGAGLGMLTQGLMPATGSLKGGGGGGGGETPNFCWVAEAIFGTDDLRTHYARYWVSNHAPRWFFHTYRLTGKPIAWVVQRSSLLKRMLKPLFERFAEKGMLKLEEARHG